MEKCFLPIIFLWSIFSGPALAQLETTSTEPLTIGEVRVITSEILNEERTLNICLPNDFNKDSTYPVIYLLDGSIDEDFLHIVGLVQFFNLQFAMPECIIVGIANVDRKRDFTFKTALKDLKTKYPTTGHSASFIDFVEKEMQPYIETTYNTSATKYLIGQSLGGLLASEILLTKGHLFSHYFIVSPSLWWDNESMLGKAEKLLENQGNFKAYVYVSVGGQEDKLMINEAEALVEVIKTKHWPDLQVTYNKVPLENHASILHQSINDAFKILFPLKEN